MFAMKTLLPVYQGPFGRAQAERLLWRAGFGPAKGEADALAAKGLQAAVRTLTRPPSVDTFAGPDPKDSRGHPLAPADASGHDHGWWLDKMVRTNRPLVERMTLVWHDWFATSNVGVAQQRLMIDQNELLRRFSLGSFKGLIFAITQDPAMLVWLSGYKNEQRAPNENYARELMELFTLGASRGYTELDVREQSRALTGFRADFRRGLGWTNFRYEPTKHDSGAKRIFGKSGRFEWKDACRLCIEHPLHPSFFVTKLWSYFVPSPPDAATQKALERLYVGERYRVHAMLEAIFRHPAFYEGPSMVKQPIVHTAGMLRAIGQGVPRGDTWAGRDTLSGQRLFYPPDVAGWDDQRWLDTATFRGRWSTVSAVIQPFAIDARTAVDQLYDPKALVTRALAFWGSPSLSNETIEALRGFAARGLADAKDSTKKRLNSIYAENGLRQLIAVSPDYLTA